MNRKIKNFIYFTSMISAVGILGVSLYSENLVIGQSEPVRLHNFKVNTQLDCSSDGSTSFGTFQIHTMATLLSDGPVDAMIGISYEPHNDNGSHKELTQIPLDRHIHSPSNGNSDFAELEGIFSLPTHANTDHNSNVVVWLRGSLLSNGQVVDFPSKFIPIPSCSKP